MPAYVCGSAGSVVRGSAGSDNSAQTILEHNNNIPGINIAIKTTAITITIARKTIAKIFRIGNNRGLLASSC